MVLLLLQRASGNKTTENPTLHTGFPIQEKGMEKNLHALLLKNALYSKTKIAPCP